MQIYLSDVQQGSTQATESYAFICMKKQHLLFGFWGFFLPGKELLPFLSYNKNKKSEAEIKKS